MAAEVLTNGVSVVEGASHREAGSSVGASPRASRGNVGDGDRLGCDVATPWIGLEQDPGRILDVDDADRRLSTVVERERRPGFGQPAKAVDDCLGLRPFVFDRARPVDDPEPQDGEIEPAAPGVKPEAELRVDLREMREVALRAIGRFASTSPVRPGP